MKTVSADRCTLEVLVAFGLFCSLAFVSRHVAWAIHVMALVGIAVPLVWAHSTGRWAEIGFTGRNLPGAVVWGIGIGLASCAIGFFTVSERSVTSNVGRELAVGIPMWLLLASPFQEFFFRGWLQPRWECILGKGWGLLAATVGFTGWHYLLPIFGESAQSSFPLYSVRGLLATFSAGLLYGYGFQRTDNMVTPWLAHALAGIMFVTIGAGSFVSAPP